MNMGIEIDDVDFAEFPLDSSEELVEEEKKEGKSQESVKPSEEVASERQIRTKPQFRVVQPDRDKDGKQIYREVGAMWKHYTKDGREFWVMKIGNLRLLVFENR